MATLGQYYDQLPHMTEQEVVEVAITHLVEQGVRSGLEYEDGKFRCMYRDNSGNCCGAAPFASPDLDLETYNNKSYAALIAGGKAHENHAELISEIQQFHDTVEPSKWLELAEKYFDYYDIDWDFLGKLN